MSNEIEYKFVKGQGWVAQYKQEEPAFAPLEWKTVPPSYYYAVDDVYWVREIQTYWNQFQQTPMPRIPRTPQEPSRYFPGSNTPAERLEEAEETIHARRLREYRDAQRRFRR